MNCKFRSLVLIILTLILAGCASTVVPKPSVISLESAMQSVGAGLYQMREAEGGLRTGLIADEVEVTFNVSASGEQGGKLSVEMTPIVTKGGKVEAEASTKYAAERGNKITIKFKNIMTANIKETLIPNTTEFEKLLNIYKLYYGKAPDTYIVVPGP